jgi:hypothetical protein
MRGVELSVRRCGGVRWRTDAPRLPLSFAIMATAQLCSAFSAGEEVSWSNEGVCRIIEAHRWCSASPFQWHKEGSPDDGKRPRYETDRPDRIEAMDVCCSGSFLAARQ